MSGISRSVPVRVEVDLSKRVLQVHAVDSAGRVVQAHRAHQPHPRRADRVRPVLPAKPPGAAFGAGRRDRGRQQRVVGCGVAGRATGSSALAGDRTADGLVRRAPSWPLASAATASACGCSNSSSCWAGRKRSWRWPTRTRASCGRCSPASLRSIPIMFRPHPRQGRVRHRSRPAELLNRQYAHWTPQPDVRSKMSTTGQTVKGVCRPRRLPWSDVLT